jgi:hypothetical protein
MNNLVFGLKFTVVIFCMYEEFINTKYHYSKDTVVQFTKTTLPTLLWGSPINCTYYPQRSPQLYVPEENNKL